MSTKVEIALIDQIATLTKERDALQEQLRWRDLRFEPMPDALYPLSTWNTALNAVRISGLWLPLPALPEPEEHKP